MSAIMVTGASSGFGEAIALGLLDAGHQIYATMRNPARAPQALAARAGPDFALGQLDVVDRASREAAIAAMLARFGRIDILINNAGIAPMSSFEDATDAFLRNVFETNFFGPSALTRLVLPLMRAQGGGRIVNMSAIGAILTTPLMNAYCASKHALDSASAALDIEARPFGVRVASVLPGRFATAINAKSPTIEVSQPYLPMFEQMQRTRDSSPPPPSDLSPVVAATLRAAFDPDPLPRYLVELGLARELIGIIPELERLHVFEAGRAGAGTDRPPAQRMPQA